MCGIAGIVSAGAPVRREDLERMAERQRHRGPDGSGVWISPNGRVGLSHRRLAILDLTSSGAQPMADESRSVHIVYNGEIYNFRELRAELERAGHGFRSQSDTEVILRGYEAWGEAVIPRLRGMFALAIWDERRQRLLLVRDRLGIKPLHWALEDGTFSFASELKGIEAGPPRERALDASALWDFLTYQYVPTPKTPYRTVHKLPAAHLLVFENGKAEIRPYWSVSFAATGERSEGDLIEELRSMLRDAVRSHLVSDVPLGVLLSGGVDSSAVTAFAAQATERLRSYSVGFDVASMSEAPFARAVARRFGTEHTEATSRVDAREDAFARMIDWFDEPFADTSAMPTALVCGIARDHVTVVLSGDGGDELFGGYRRYGKFCRQQGRDFLPRPMRPGVGAAFATLFGRGTKARRSIQRWAMEDVGRYALLHGGMTRADKRDVLPAEVVARFEDYDDYWLFRQHWREDLDPWSRMQYVDLKTYLPDDLLTKIDRVSMQVSLEVRPPFLDHRFVEFAAGIPSGRRVRDGTMKYLLKRALDGILGPESLERGKQGFSMPLEGTGLFESAPETAQWPPSHRAAWSLLKKWTQARRGGASPLDLLREGP